MSSGLGVATVEVAQEIARQAEGSVVHTVRGGAEPLAPAPVHESCSLIAPDHCTLGPLARMDWCQTRLPWLLRRDEVDILYSTVEEGLLWGDVHQVVIAHDALPLLYPEAYPRRQRVFISDKARRSSLARSRLQSAKKFSWSRTAAGVLRVLEEAHAGIPGS